ncbi:MAG: hypothetical protein RLZZ301_925 [Bacteroidota bacterium]|jgi:A/G-specific adenine glycosylase
MKAFSSTLISWYEQHKRDLPWRHSLDPYCIWLSEIILQQTRVDQGLAYYYKFTENYPTVTDLAHASETEVLRTWQGLGYYSRARNLHQTAQLVVNEFGGVFPTTYEGLLRLKGIGPYTAAAIASFAYCLPHAVVDGNVFRVLSRYYGIDLPINSTKGKHVFEQLANEVLDKKNPALHNQAIMEFGAIQCKPLSPACNQCPLQESCVAVRQGLVGQLPVKEKKTKVRDRYFVYHVWQDAVGKIPMKQRGAGDIWQGLYEFPLLEFESAKQQQAHVTMLAGTASFGPFKHVLSHQRLHVYFCATKLATPNASFSFIDPKDVQDFPIPRLIDRFLDSHASELFF